MGVAQMFVCEMQDGWLEATKKAYTTAQVDLGHARALIPDAVPRAGDLVVAEVVKIGHHKRLELRDGRRAALFTGDHVVVCYGSRYAPDQFHAELPRDLGPCHLAAAGGIASRVTERHSSVGEPTVLRPAGLLADVEGRRINLADWTLPSPVDPPSIRTIVVVGTAMNAGKTTTAAHLVRGLSAAGLRTGAAKVTGTGAGGDRFLMADAGASPCLDFTLAGLASTYKASAADVERSFTLLRDTVAEAGAEAVVIEIADGLAQAETRMLLESRVMRDVDALVFCAGDALGAAAGVRLLSELRLPVRAVSGVVTASPLAAEEAAALTGLAVLGLDELQDAELASALLQQQQQPTRLAAVVAA